MNSQNIESKVSQAKYHCCSILKNQVKDAHDRMLRLVAQATLHYAARFERPVPYVLMQNTTLY